MVVLWSSDWSSCDTLGSMRVAFYFISGNSMTRDRSEDPRCNNPDGLTFANEGEDQFDRLDRYLFSYLPNGAVPYSSGSAAAGQAQGAVPNPRDQHH